ncbi:glycosyl hydrolase [Burkholderia pseudomallei]|uniref:WD40/YVTN/BNR-like repeat-containing protein n=1 Tax=Burkholderia pseudomallei TaxID=28450 RepID=UPI000F29EF8C|nr:hypothetical protein [Burkholderia pseudomallei]CAJ5232921.1 glycosyl hydrolase [Burkholderia pseudomallei]CAJ7565798.1 glycosyl hydrolase [Burkholderia pseudomallei]CAK0348654.1 glycosyl hydrolase [Burkholderia pseudomallei]VCH22773.1 glycosyl hydrolase [Burkholderia pseudomallei]VCH61705.1 glycosyl hydrolase [Burkholderia pseudomallei]
MLTTGNGDHMHLRKTFEKAYRLIGYPLALLALLVFADSAIAEVHLAWTFAEAQPDVREGGRANSIAVDPFDSTHIIVASEGGGLFQSRDRGVNWRHVPDFPLYKTAAVSFHPQRQGMVIATAGDTFGAVDRGGIYVSTNGGWTWHLAVGAPLNAADRFSASAITIAPDNGEIFVATSLGLSASADGGGSWRSISTGGGGAVAVVALGNNVLLAGDSGATRVSPDGGATWSAVNSPGGITDMHALAGSTVSRRQAYAVTADLRLHVTYNAGGTWQDIATPAQKDPRCGGIALVKAGTIVDTRIANRVVADRLYYGERCALYSVVARNVSLIKPGSWWQATVDRGDVPDTRDIALASTGSRPPLFLATDGGIHAAVPGTFKFTYTGGGRFGYNALEITEIRAQYIQSLNRYDWYYGTQDNHLKASTDGGVTWPTENGGEGFFIQALKQVPSAAQSQITAVSCGPCGNVLYSAGMTAATGWKNPPGVKNIYNPVILDHSYHVQGIDEGGLQKGFGLTKDLSSTWTQFATMPDDRDRDLPKVTRHRVRALSRMAFYVPIVAGVDPETGSQRVVLSRVTKRLLGDTGYISYPQMTGLRSIGLNPTMFAWYRVWGVDPTDSRFLMAADHLSKAVLRSSDGGNTWQDVGINQLVTDSGRFRFDDGGSVPFVSAISYSPDNPSTVAIGTHQNGVFISGDRGSTWRKVPGSEGATNITSIEWRPGWSEAYVSSYGRGLWKLQQELLGLRFDLLCRVVDCFERVIDPHEYEQWGEHGLAVIGGEILDVQTRGSRVMGVTISRGASTALIGEDGWRPRFKILEATPTRHAIHQGAQAGRAVRALALDRSERLLRRVMTARRVMAADLVPASASPEAPLIEEDERSQLTPYSAPSIKMTAEDRMFLFVPGEEVQLTVERLAPSSQITVQVDGKPVAEEKSDAQGKLLLQTRAPLAPGLHTLDLRLGESQRAVASQPFVVGHVEAGDEEKERRERSLR